MAKEIKKDDIEDTISDKEDGDKSVATNDLNKESAKSKDKVLSIDLLKDFEDSQIKKELPSIYVGDTVKVGVKITEGNKERVQPYELSLIHI